MTLLFNADGQEIDSEGEAMPQHAVGSAETLGLPVPEPVYKSAPETSRARIRMQGKFRIYFNHHGAAPLVWCVSPEDGEFEIAIKGFELRVDAESIYRKKEEADEDDGRPSGWISCVGDLEIEDGIARISP